MIYRSISVEMACDSTVPEERARLLAERMARTIRMAAYSWIAVQDIPSGVEFVVDGEHLTQKSEAA